MKLNANPKETKDTFNLVIGLIIALLILNRLRLL